MKNELNTTSEDHKVEELESTTLNQFSESAAVSAIADRGSLSGKGRTLKLFSASEDEEKVDLPARYYITAEQLAMAESRQVITKPESLSRCDAIEYRKAIAGFLLRRHYREILMSNDDVDFLSEESLSKALQGWNHQQTCPDGEPLCSIEVVRDVVSNKGLQLPWILKDGVMYYDISYVNATAEEKMAVQIHLLTHNGTIWVAR